MSDSPPSLRETLSGRTGLVVGLLTLFVLAYSFLVAGNALVLPALSIWLFYRFVRARADRERGGAAASERRARAAETRAGIDPASGPSSAGRDADDARA